ncbi:MAG TPA: dicarboxylate/amino acid:cation symporter [Gemmatimonadetes bacterium]|jgi:Na+/H+-dicarboxylate symporter|nr:dicarboxylate/amino acid:cation symporter [Gemmatimonadota bacterium]
MVELSPDKNPHNVGIVSIAYGYYRNLSLGSRILLFMVLGSIGGIMVGEPAKALQPLGDLFIKLLIMAAVPLIFFNLLAGMTGLADLKAFRRLFLKIIVFYGTSTVLAMMTGLFVISLIKPGIGMDLTQNINSTMEELPSIANILTGLFPENIFAAFASGNVSQIVMFSIFLGIATVLLPEKKRKTLSEGFALVAELLRMLVDVIMRFGPLGIGALAAATLGQYGSQIFGPLSLFILGIWLAMLLMTFTYLVLLRIFSEYAPLNFLQKTFALWATTASTCSSLASLSVAFEMAEEKLKVPQDIYSFTLPLGAQLNKDGTAIILGGTLLFTAQAAGIEFTPATLFPILIMGAVLSMGSGGIPSGGVVVSLVFVQAFGLPLEIAAMVTGVYRLLDMASTTVNVMGDMVGTCIVSHSECNFFCKRTT